jgi:hypothetical protein
MNTHHGDTEARSSSGLLSESLTEAINGAAIEVHRQLGPGLLESIYERLLSIHEAQLLTDLRLTGKRVGLLINFNVSALHPWNHAPGSMISIDLRASVSPRWVFCMRRLSA